MRWVVVVAVGAWIISPDVQRFVWNNGMAVAIGAVVFGVAMYAHDSYGGFGRRGSSSSSGPSPGRPTHYKHISSGTMIKCTCDDPSCW